MWSQISALSDLLAAIAVILSLLYVGRQIKHSRDASVSAMTHQASDFATRIHWDITKDPELARIYNLGRDDLKTLTETERSIGWYVCKYICRLQQYIQSAQ